MTQRAEHKVLVEEHIKTPQQYAKVFNCVVKITRRLNINPSTIKNESSVSFPSSNNKSNSLARLKELNIGLVGKGKTLNNCQFSLKYDAGAARSI